MPTVELGDVVDRVKDNVDKDDTDLEYYVGGEHFDSGKVEVKRKAAIKGSTIGPAFHMRFEPGDVLLMSRNPHLRKAAKVDFEGLCSDVSYVCRTKDNNILLQNLLPFIFQTDSFWEFAEEHKKGSTNFFLNWSDFKKYKFYLPELDEQKELSKILWQFIHTIDNYEKLLTRSDDLVKARFVEMFGDPTIETGRWKSKKLTDLGKCKNGMNFHQDDSGVKIHCLGVGDFKDNNLITDISLLPYITLNSQPADDYLLRDEDIVFVRSNGNKALVGRSVQIFPKDIPTTFSGFCIRFRLESTEVQSRYLLQLLKIDSVRQQMAGRGANIQNLNQQILSNINVPIPPIELQLEYVDFVQQVDKSKAALQKEIDDLDAMYKRILKDNLG